MITTNQGSWEGIGLAENELGIERNYMQPAGETEVDYLTEIQNLMMQILSL